MSVIETQVECKVQLTSSLTNIGFKQQEMRDVLFYAKEELKAQEVTLIVTLSLSQRSPLICGVNFFTFVAVFLLHLFLTFLE